MTNKTIASNAVKAEQSIEQKISSNTRNHRIKVATKDHKNRTRRLRQYRQFKRIRKWGAIKMYRSGNKRIW